MGQTGGPCGQYLSMEKRPSEKWFFENSSNFHVESMLFCPKNRRVFEFHVDSTWIR